MNRRITKKTRKKASLKQLDAHAKADARSKLIIEAVGLIDEPEKYMNAAANFIQHVRHPREVHKTYPDYAPISCNEFHQQLGQSKKDKAITEWFKSTVFEVTPNYSRDKGISKGYKLQPAAKKALDKIELEYKPTKQQSHTRADGSIVRNPSVTPERKGGMKLPTISPWCPVNLPAIEHGIEIVKKWISSADNNSKRPDVLREELEAIAQRYHCKTDEINQPMQEYLHRVLAELNRINTQANIKNHHSQILQQYKQSDAGRWYSYGATGRVHLQRCSKLARVIALNGFHQYDISSCHHAIALQIAERDGIPCESLAYYVANKEDFRQELAKLCGIDESRAKKALIAMIYGATSRPLGTIQETLTKEGLIKANTHPIFVGLKAEIRKIQEHMESIAPRHEKSGDVMNALELSERWGNDFKQRTRLRAHLLQGIEAQALNAALGVHSSAVLPLHDGWITQVPENIEQAENAILTATGFTLKIDEKQYQIGGLES